MINITFPDGSLKQFPLNITGLEIAQSISKSLANDAFLLEVNSELKDLSHKIEADCSVRILTIKDPKCLETIRHDAAHILAQSVKELFEDVQVTIGPAIENGFYYDFATSRSFSTGDIVKIEAKMYEVVLRNDKITRYTMQRDEAVEFFKQQGEKYKAEIISSIPEHEEITLYKQGNFTDLCRGPHGPSTGFIKHFKLMKVAGAYWRGDSNNEMLQRVYGVAFATKQELDDHLHMLEEAEKRDHRKIGKELELFHFQNEAQGVPYWHSKGWSIYCIIQNYIRNKLRKYGYREVNTPQLVDKHLWELSGHWEKFRENMFILENDDRVLCLKPMSCPNHVQIFKQGIKSYRDLPLRMSEFGCCHRNESSGGLHGLMRVRAMTQDDGHIFCTEEQMKGEIISFYNLLKSVYEDFGFTKIQVKLSDRPDVRAGSDSIWDTSENALKEALEFANLEYTINKGEGAFYGPKLEFCLKDAIGRDWQCGTLQVDFIMPERLDASYIDQDNNKKRPIMLHRAILGSLERFIGILIEEYTGKMPLWLAPTQVAIVNITNKEDDYAKNLYNKFLSNNIRAELDISNQKVQYKIRHFSTQKVPLICVVGAKEMQENNVCIRYLGNNDQKTMLVDDFINFVLQENKKYI